MVWVFDPNKCMGCYFERGWENSEIDFEDGYDGLWFFFEDF